MTVGIYWAGLLVLLLGAGVLIGKDVIAGLLRRVLGRSREGSQQPQNYCPEKNEEAKKFRRTFLQVYLLVMSGEWLQVRSC